MYEKKEKRENKKKKIESGEDDRGKKIKNKREVENLPDLSLSLGDQQLAPSSLISPAFSKKHQGEDSIIWSHH